jgi:catechol-2,3-dioxygenase
MSQLTFIYDKQSKENYYHFAFNIPENQINESIEWLKKKINLIEYEGSPLINFKNWNAHSVYFYDAGGNIVEFIARHNLKNGAGEPFSPNSIINISEVGMPVESVKDFCSKLDEKPGLKLWWGNLETFAAIGDEEGLLIVVTSQRNWFPTEKSSKIYPLTVKIANNKRFEIDSNGYKITNC